MSGRMGLLGGSALLAACLALTLPGVAEARTSVVVGVGVGPVMPAYPHHHHHPHYYYPPVYVAPPPVVVYEPGPPVVFAQPPVVQTPLPVNPAGPIYMSRSGQLCREYQSTIMIGGVPQPSHGTACQQPDGSWRIVN